MYIPPQKGRASINTIGENVQISIPTAKNIIMILFVSFWLCGWFLGEVTVIGSLFFNPHHTNDSFLLFWLCGWTIGGGYALVSLLWNVAGKEVVTFQKGIIKIEKKVFDIGLTREYSLSSAGNFRITNQDNSNTWIRLGTNFGGLGGNGKIKFDYGMKTINFGVGIDEAEGKYILDELRQSGYIN